MRVRTLILTGSLILGATGCGSSTPAPKTSSNIATWRAGHAVVVLIADVQPGTSPDVASLGRRPGVISAWTKNQTLRVSFGRAAMLADMAALKLEMERSPGLADVREVVVAPT